MVGPVKPRSAVVTPDAKSCLSRFTPRPNCSRATGSSRMFLRTTAMSSSVMVVWSGRGCGGVEAVGEVDDPFDEIDGGGEFLVRDGVVVHTAGVVHQEVPGDLRPVQLDAVGGGDPDVVALVG